MQINPAPELREQALQALRDEYQLNNVRPGLHQSELSYCLTKAYWNKTDPVPPSDKAAVMFGIGFAMERVMLEGDHPDPIEIDGITMSLDSLTAFQMPVDLKTTRAATVKSSGCGICGEPFKGHSKSTNGHSFIKGETVPFELPKGWVRQAAAYRYALNRQELEMQDEDMVNLHYDFSFVVIHLVEADVSTWTITFTPAELEENWQRLLTRKEWLERMLESDNPNPFESAESWECEGCQYLLRCQLAASQQRLSTKNVIPFPYDKA